MRPSLACWPVLALLLACGLAPAPALAEPEGGVEELADADGFLGYRPGLPFVEGAWPSRLGPPQDRSEGNGPTRSRSLWWGTTAAEAEEAGVPPTGLELQLEPNPKGGWAILSVTVGKAFHIQPRIHGQRLEQGEEIRARLPGHLEQGLQLYSQEEGLELMPYEGASSPGNWALAMLFPKRLPGLLARTTRLHQAIAQGPWPMAPQHLALHRALATEPGVGPTVLIPAKLLSSRPLHDDDTQVALELQLARHAWAQASAEELEAGLRRPAPPSQRWRLVTLHLGSAERLEPGDLVVLQARWHGPHEGAPGGLRGWRVEDLSLFMAHPGRAPLAHPELWLGLPPP